ncbi:MAG TPA: acyl-CoA dehydrogenase family protein [Terrimesophilobacter sp.]|nr:acyl-CoA dehydrogenase family protein [Terrimesophilobacter sp.]
MSESAFREEVREWFRENAPRNWADNVASLEEAEFVEHQRRWLQLLNTRGFGSPHVPREWGGGGFSVQEQVVVYEEWVRSGAPPLDTFLVSRFHVPSTLLLAGSIEQQERFVRAAIDGQIWCQGFSEPEAGSDLASLRARATPVEGGWLISGQKTWSSNAHLADYCLLLARTGTEESRAKSITYFILDMSSSGVSVRPIRQINGHSEFSEVFLDDVFVPSENVIGNLNEGWSIAQSTLQTERGPIGVELIERCILGIEQLSSQIGDETSAESVKLAALSAHAFAVRALAYDIIAADDLKSFSVLKVAYTELIHDVADFGMQLAGLSVLQDGPERHFQGWVTGNWSRDWLSSWGNTIAAGATEVQLDIIANTLLAMPREPRPSGS